MSVLDLDAIEVREREAWPERDDSNDDKDRLRASVNDVAPLVAEVRRLRDTVDAALAIHGEHVRLQHRVESNCVCTACQMARALDVWTDDEEDDE